MFSFLAPIVIREFFKSLFRWVQNVYTQMKVAQLNIDKGRLQQSVDTFKEGEKTEQEVQAVAEKPVTDDDFERRAKEGTL